MKIVYQEKRFSDEHFSVIEHANEIIDEYAAQGYDLTLRQLYYQFVSRDLIPNNDRSYKRLGNIVSDARRAGLVDWDRIVDRTRYLRKPSAWESPAEIVEVCGRQFDIDWWENQDYRPEVWIEKDALIGVLEVACEEWHCPYFSCRGYVSDSEAWAAGQRYKAHYKSWQEPIVFHLGDHDPSGIDMTRDIQERISLFCGKRVNVVRVALTMTQVEEFDPPPNPAKTTDARFKNYQEEYGDESWELDALSPTTIGKVISKHIEPLVSKVGWQENEARRDTGREHLAYVAENWNEVKKALKL